MNATGLTKWTTGSGGDKHPSLRAALRCAALPCPDSTVAASKWQQVTHWHRLRTHSAYYAQRRFQNQSIACFSTSAALPLRHLLVVFPIALLLLQSAPPGLLERDHSIDRSIAMVEGHPYGLGGWGVGGVFKEAGRLQVRYFSLLAPFIFAFVLPLTLLQLLEIFGLAWWAEGGNPFLPPGPHPGSFLFQASSAPLPPTPSGRGVFIGVAGSALLLVLGSLAVSVLLWLLASLAVASFCKTVQYIYSEREEDSSAIKSIFQSLPGALFRLFVTTVWVLLLTLVTIFTVSLPFYLLSLIFKHSTILPILQRIFVSLAVTILGFLFLLSQEVAALEHGNYGLAALKRSSKLVEEKFLTALTLFVVTNLVGAVLSYLSNLIAGKLSSGKLPPWSVYLLAVLLALLYLLFTVYVLLAIVVLYFSSKAKYDADEDSLPVDNPYTPLVVPAEQ